MVDAHPSPDHAATSAMAVHCHPKRTACTVFHDSLPNMRVGLSGKRWVWQLAGGCCRCHHPFVMAHAGNCNCIIAPPK